MSGHAFNRYLDCVIHKTLQPDDELAIVEESTR